MISPEKFLKITKGEKAQTHYRLGKIDPAYTTGRPAIVFDGETTATEKEYPYLGSYTPAANDRVLLLRISSKDSVSSSYVIIGKVI